MRAVEDIIQEIILELNNEEHWKKNAAVVEGTLKSRQALIFINHAISFLSAGLESDLVNSIFRNVRELYGNATAPLQLMNTASPLQPKP